MTSVTIGGAAKVGETLTANTTPIGATVNYKWQKASTESGAYSDIEEATNKTFRPTESEKGNFIKVVVTGTGDYTGTKTSAATAAVQAAGG